MSGIKKLELARSIIINELSILIKTLDFEPKLARIHILMRDNVRLFIRYNNYGEYSYTIIFSKEDLDRCRFDNYDDKWDVSTRPHHVHLRKKREVIASKMIGDPEEDILYLCDLIKTRKIFSLE